MCEPFRSSDEAERAHVSVGTAALLEYLLEQQSNCDSEVKYTFCLGADAFMDLTAGKWKESARVLTLLQGRFLVFHRIEEGNDNKNAAITNTSRLAIQERVQSVPGARLISVPSLGAVSSSRVREAVAAQDWNVFQSDETMVDPKVLTYIRDNGLYNVVPSSSS